MIWGEIYMHILWLCSLLQLQFYALFVNVSLSLYQCQFWMLSILKFLSIRYEENSLFQLVSP